MNIQATKKEKILRGNCHVPSWIQQRCRLCRPWSWRWISQHFPSIRPSWCVSCHRSPWWRSNSLAKTSSWQLICISDLKDKDWMRLKTTSNMKARLLSNKYIVKESSSHCCEILQPSVFASIYGIQNFWAIPPFWSVTFNQDQETLFLSKQIKSVTLCNRR